MEASSSPVISIHAPAKGATTVHLLFHIRSMNFNPRSREGSDTLNWYVLPLMIISIHAPAKGATGSLSATGIQSLFQSTLPRRERHRYWIPANVRSLFQSTLPRRERRGLCNRKELPAEEFQSTLPRRERPTNDFLK